MESVEKYILFDSLPVPFRFEYANNSRIFFKPSEKGKYWFDIIYPDIRGRLYCTYSSGGNNNYHDFENYVRRSLLIHMPVATDIREEMFENPDKQFTGYLFELDGPVASPLQFMLTDTTRHFLNASFYFDHSAYADSLKSALDIVKKDVRHLIETFEWK